MNSRHYFCLNGQNFRKHTLSEPRCFLCYLKERVACSAFCYFQWLPHGDGKRSGALLHFQYSGLFSTEVFFSTCPKKKKIRLSWISLFHPSINRAHGLSSCDPYFYLLLPIPTTTLGYFVPSFRYIFLLTSLLQTVRWYTHVLCHHSLLHSRASMTSFTRRFRYRPKILGLANSGAHPGSRTRRCSVFVWRAMLP